MSWLQSRVVLRSDTIDSVAERAADFIKKGYAVVFPTDTIYGLGVNALDESAVERFFALKKRPATKPVPVFVKDNAMANDIAFIDSRQEEILRSFLPGPFTFILRARNIVPSRLCAGTGTIGLRIPNHPFCASLLGLLDVPITASSANISGLDATTNVDEIVQQFKEHSTVPEYIVDAGELQSVVPSTVIDITKEKARIVRMSPTTPDMIQKITSLLGELGDVEAR